MPLKIVFAGPMFTPRALVPLELIVPIGDAASDGARRDRENAWHRGADRPGIADGAGDGGAGDDDRGRRWPWRIATLETVMLVICAGARRQGVAEKEGGDRGGGEKRRRDAPP